MTSISPALSPLEILHPIPLDGGSRAAGAERISGRGKPHAEEPVEWAIESLDAERAMLGKIGHRLGRQALAEVATVARPDTILAWYRKLVARHALPPAPERKRTTTWPAFIRTHLALLASSLSD